MPRKPCPVLSAAAFLALALSPGPGAHAHDIYTGLRTGQGTPCCGGDPVTGDCEALDEGQFTVRADGSLLVRSHRYAATVQVAAEKVTWLPLPPGLDGKVHPAHWCGVPRAALQARYPVPVVPYNPDPAFWTYCAFVAPGGA